MLDFFLAPVLPFRPSFLPSFLPGFLPSFLDSFFPSTRFQRSILRRLKHRLLSINIFLVRLYFGYRSGRPSSTHDLRRRSSSHVQHSATAGVSLGCIPPAKLKTSVMHELRAYKGMGIYDRMIERPEASMCDGAGRMTALPVS